MNNNYTEIEFSGESANKGEDIRLTENTTFAKVTVLDVLDDNTDSKEVECRYKDCIFPVRVKPYLTAEETVEFIEFVKNGIITEEGGYNPLGATMYYEAAVLTYFTDITEQVEDFNLQQAWELIGKTDIKSAVKAVISPHQLESIEKATQMLDFYISGYIQGTQETASEKVVSAFAGISLGLSDIIDRINEYLDVFEKQVLDEDGNLDFESITSAIKTLSNPENKEIIGDTIKSFIIGNMQSKNEEE